MSGLKKIRGTILLISAILFIIIFKSFIMNKVIVSGDSMLDTFTNGDVLWIDKTVSDDDIKRFDVVVINTKRDALKKRIVKRIIALPNETVLIRDGKVFINGVMLADDYGDLVIDGGIAVIPFTLKDDEYFVMGDNRNGSLDSRNALLGAIKKDMIDGKVFFQIFPLNKIRKVD